MPIQRFSNIDFDRWDSLRSAIDELIDDGGPYHQFVSWHLDFARDIHHSPIFLPWHRAYLIKFERALCNIDPSLSIPYWDWNDDGGELREFSDLLGLSSGRDLGARRGESSGRVPWFTSETQINRLLRCSGGYERFRQALEEGPHNDGHDWVGGDMADPRHSPNDPAFWFHHAQIDRIWALWQQRYPDEMAPLPEREAQLDPWGDEFTVRSVNNISELGNDSYEYV